MKRWLVSTLVAAVILTLGVVAALNSSGSSEESFDGPGNSAAAHSRNDDRKADKGGKNKEDKAEKGEKADENDGNGPPSWAHRKDSKSDRAAAREEWRKLTPQQRRELMDRLVREHTEAMQKWGECVAADRDDCEMPTPPGLAKKQGR